MGLYPVKNTRLYEVVVNRIEDMIKTEKLKPGDKLPSERDMMELYNVSRSVIREAFRVLESKGVVKSRPGGGRYLATTTDHPMEMVSLYNIEYGTISDFIEARELIEADVARLACIRAERKDINRLKSIVNDLIYRDNLKLKEYREKDKDLEFHIALAEATHNFMLKEIMTIQIQFAKNLNIKNYINEKEWLGLCEDHMDILRAVEDKNIDKAQALIKKHIESLKSIILSEDISSRN
ncbi:MAG: FadR/GntR family transcriptional regulator [Thermoanaerobacteraceae bacterium]|nr:FadR/GntR family transcriptional regulator [Thermoanaerobacteraceae bacterium]